MKLTLKIKADLLLFITASGWALSTILIKLYIDTIPVFHLMLGRYFIGFVILLALQKSKLKNLTKQELKSGSLLGILNFLAFTFAITSLTYTSASKSGFLVAMSVLFVPIVTTLLKNKLPNKWTIFSVGMSVVGLYYVSGMNGGSFNLGDLLALLCAVSYTVYILLLDKYAKDIEESKLVILQLGIVSLISLFFVVFYEGFQLQVLIDGFIPILIIAIFGTTITNYAQTKAQKHASPESVGLILLGEPLLTLIMAAFILKEVILVKGLIGASIILIALVITVVKKI